MRDKFLALLLTGSALAFTSVASVSGQAAEFKLGEANLFIDSIGSIGFGMRTSGQDCALISAPNGGCTQNGATFGVNDDDGNVNFEQWDFYSTTAKVTTDVDLRWRNYGAFVRASAFYDYIGAEEAGENSTRFGRRPLNDSSRGDSPSDRAGRNIRLLDAFVYGDFNVGDLPVNLRLGNQVINWGESLFIQGGINSNLAFDVTALRTPGSELKEALLPQQSIYASVGLPSNFNLEAYYVFNYERTQIDTVGTFFSGSDAAGAEGAYVMNGVEYGEPAMTPAGPLTPAQMDAAGFLVPRTAGSLPDDQGQWGAKIGYYADWLNGGSDLGLYFHNFHSKLPVGTFTASQVPGSPNYGQSCAGVLGAASAAPTTSQQCTGNPDVIGGILLSGAAFKEYRNTYQEDIRLFGASFNTTIPLLGGTALAGEFAYSDNMPFQVSDVEINSNDLDRSLTGQAFALAQANPGWSADQLAAALTGLTASPTLSSWDSLATSGEIPGFKREDVLTGQIHTTSTFSGSHPAAAGIGADLLILLSNVGFQYLPDISDKNHRFSIARSGAGHPNPVVDNLLGQGQGISKYASSASWGYRLVGVANYNNAFGTPWTLSPSLQFAHDVQGYSAGPIGPGFTEGKKTVSAGLTADLQNTWKAQVSYTTSFGNSFRNFARDKDFATFNISYAF